MTKKNVQNEWAILKHISTSIGYGLLFFFVITNMLFSQRIPQLYFDLWKNNQIAFTEFLKQAKATSYFSLLFPEIKVIFSSKEDEVYAEERRRRELTQKLELLREQNPKSRDILYSLYLLYEKAGEYDKAQEYLLQAQQIDPTVDVK